MIETIKQALDWFRCFRDKSMSRNNAEELAAEIEESLRQAIEQAEKQETLDFSRGWDAGYSYAAMRFKNNFEQYFRLAITAAVEKAGVKTFEDFVNHYKNENCKEKTHD